MANYTTLQRVKDEMGITDSLQDARIIALIAESSARMDAYCGRAFEQKTVTENVAGYGTSFLTIAYTPLISITSIALNEEVIPVADYAIHDSNAGIIWGNWQNTAQQRQTIGMAQYQSQHKKSYQVTYVGGYAIIPADIERACIEVVRSAVNGTGKDSNITQESVNGVYGVTYGSVTVSSMAHVDDTLRKYRVVVI